MSSIADAAMQRSFAARSLRELSPDIDSHRFTLLANNPIGYGGCCAAIRDMDQVALLGRITMPVLVIGGDEDASTPWSGHGDLLAESIPGAIGKCLQAGHMSNLEQPDLFTSALLDFLISAPTQT
jgi:pimeloyl-ACP methyl ester carboxylesterase